MKIKVLPIVFLLLVSKAYAQKEYRDAINFYLMNSKVNGNPTEGLKLKDTNKVVKMVINWNKASDTNVISFDDKGRIVYTRTKYGINKFNYKENEIIKDNVPYYPTPLTWTEDTITYKYILDNAKKIDTVLVKWENKKRVFDLKYINLSNGEYVNWYESDTLFGSDLFLFNEKEGLIQWNSIENTAFTMFKRKRYRNTYKIISSFGVSSSYKRVIIDLSYIETSKHGFLTSDNNGPFNIYDPLKKRMGQIKLLWEDTPRGGR